MPARDAATYVEQVLAGAGTGYEARVTVHAPMEQIQKRVPWISGSLTRVDDHRCEYRTADDDLEWLALRIAMLGADVEVDGAPELLAQLDALGRRLRRAASPAHQVAAGRGHEGQPVVAAQPRDDFLGGLPSHRA